MTLTEFLLARFDEDESKVRGIKAPWWMENTPLDPARVRDDLEAKRRIVEWHVRGNDDGYVCRNILCPHLASLASIYADHPDWREEWRP